jgi:hypothetical protein
MAKRVVTVLVDLPVEVYDELERLAGPGRRRVGALISRRVQKERARPIPRAKLRSTSASPLEKWYGAFKGGKHGSNNQKIDEDIAREIAGNPKNGKRK